MADDFLTKLCARAGIYEGEGVNHEGQNFAGTMALRPLFGGLGVALWFRATGAGGAVFHEELTLVGPALAGGMAMTSLSTNFPGLQNFNGTPESGTFAYGDLQNDSGFRERVTFGFADDGGLSYAFAWGLPGQEFMPRSTVTMRKSETPVPRDCPICF